MIKEDEDEPLSQEQGIQRDVDDIFCDTILILYLDFRKIQKSQLSESDYQ